METTVFPIAPGDASESSAIWVLIGVIILMLLFALLFVYIIHSIKNCRFEMSSQGLQILGDIYGKFIPRVSLITEEARIVNLNVEKSLKPMLKTNGIGLPGYASGWFRLPDWKKALLFITDLKEVVYIPTKDGYSLMITPENPQEFLALLKEMK
jgi:hypothetical protein